MRPPDNMSIPWRQAMRQYFAKGFPRDYIVLDTETTGVQPMADLVLQLGCLIVRCGQIVHQSSVYLDWAGAGLVHPEWLQNKMSDTAAQMASRGATYRLDFDTVRREGKDPRIMIPALDTILRQGLDNGLSLIGHNMAAFDLVLLSRHIRELTSKPLLIPTTLVWDTGMLEKARQMNSVPNADEDQVAWFQRTYHRRARVKWKLDGHCAETYGLWARSGLDPAAAHDAGSDCLLTHHLFQALQEFIEAPCSVG